MSEPRDSRSSLLPMSVESYLGLAGISYVCFFILAGVSKAASCIAPIVSLLIIIKFVSIAYVIDRSLRLLALRGLILVATFVPIAIMLCR